MISILQRYFDICLLRAAPQDIPSSTFLLGLTLLMYTGVGFLLSLSTMPTPRALTLAIIDVISLAGFCYLLLWIRVLTNRFTQTLIALAGSGVILQLIVWPIVLLQQQTVLEQGAGLLLSSLLIWAWLLWNLIVVGHILRHTLSTSLFIGGLFALLYMYITLSIINSFFSMVQG